MGSPYDPSQAVEPLPPRKGADEANARREARRQSERDEAAKPRKRKKAPLLLLLLLLVVGAGVYVVLTADDDDGPTAAERAEQSRQIAAGAAEDELVMGEARLTAGDTPLIPPPDVVERLVGRRVTGTGVSVVDVTQSGYFVTIGGTQETQGIGEAAGPAGRTDRVYVASEDRPQRGARIDLRGRVRDVPADVRRRLDLPAEEADLVRSAGFYVQAQ